MRAPGETKMREQVSSEFSKRPSDVLRFSPLRLESRIRKNSDETREVCDCNSERLDAEVKWDHERISDRKVGGIANPERPEVSILPDQWLKPT